ncbi:MAG: DUF935 family protein [Opitutaceae bacterium]|jgi:phage gp29-like protein
MKTHRTALLTLLFAAFAFVALFALSHNMYADDAAGTAAGVVAAQQASGGETVTDAATAGQDLISSFIVGLAQKFPWLLTVVSAIGALRFFFKPLMTLIEKWVKSTPSTADDAMLLEDYQAGRMADLQWTYFFLEQTDPDMIGLLENRISRLLEMDYNVQTEKEADQAKAKHQADLISEKLSAIDNLYEAIEHLAMASFRGFAHCEKQVNSDGEIFHLELVDQWNVVRDGMRGPWKYNPTARSTDYQGLRDTEDLPLDRFLYREVRRPINRFALLKFIRANLSEKDWDAFNEIYNVPGGVVIGPPNIPSGEREEYASAAQRVAEGGSGYLPNGSTYTANEMPHDPATFKARLDHLSEKLVLAGTGGMLTMLAVSGSGTLAGGVHDKVFSRISKGDARRVSEVINKQLVAQWLFEDFPNEPQLAFFALAANEETDTGDAVEQVSKLSSAGYQVDPAQVTEKTGWLVTIKAIPQLALPAPGADPSLRKDPAPGTDQEAATEASAKDEPQATVSNRATGAAGREQRFLASSSVMLGQAEQAAMKPLLDRIAPLMEADDAAFEAGMRQLQADLPALEKQILGSHSELEQAFEEIIGSALVGGLAEAAQTRQTAKSQRIEKEAIVVSGGKNTRTDAENAPAPVLNRS